LQLPEELARPPLQRRLRAVVDLLPVLADDVVAPSPQPGEAEEGARHPAPSLLLVLAPLRRDDVLPLDGDDGSSSSVAKLV
jgi:hypothetical protein